MEKWKIVEGHPNYEISSLRRIRNVKTGRMLSSHFNNGHERVKIDGKLYYIDRLILESFNRVDEYETDRNHSNIVRCRYCKHSYDGEWDFCNGQDDDFYCGHGEY